MILKSAILYRNCVRQPPGDMRHLYSIFPANTLLDIRTPKAARYAALGMCVGRGYAAL